MSWAARFLIRQYLRESLWVVPFLGPVIVLLLGGKTPAAPAQGQGLDERQLLDRQRAHHRPVRRRHREQPVSGY